MAGSRDMALISLGTTPGLRRADAAFQEMAEAAGVGCELIRVRIGAAGRLRRQITVTDLVEAMAARRAARAASAAPVIVFSTVTAALLQRPRVPYAIRFDSPAALNRPGPAGAWQRARELRAMRGAALLLPWGQAAADALPEAARATPVVPLHVPVEVGAPAADVRDIDALAYAGYPEKRGLDLLVRAWSAAAQPGQRLVVAGVERERGEAWLRGRGVEVPAGTEWRGLMERSEWEATLRRTRVFVNASRREDHGLSQLEALTAGAMLVTVPSPGPYEALPIARRLEPRFVADVVDADALAAALRAALAGDAGGGAGAAAASGADGARAAYAERAARELAPYSRGAVRAVFEERVLPALGLR